MAQGENVVDFGAGAGLGAPSVRALDFGDEKAKGTPGRVDGGQEQAVVVEKITGKLEHLLKLYRKAEEAKEDLSDAIKAVAEAGGVHASVLKRFIAARGGENFTKARAKSAQLELLFEEIGE